jgi:hypothetical protein
MNTNSTTNGGAGLLEGVDVQRDEKYNDNLDYWDALQSPGFLLRAAALDAVDRTYPAEAYIKDILGRYDIFLKSDYIAGRKDLKSFLGRAIISSETMGKVSIVWGPRSTGKTRLLATQCSSYSGNSKYFIVYVNALDDQSLAKGIAAAVDRLVNEEIGDKTRILKAMAATFSGILNAAQTMGLVQAAAATTTNAVVDGSVAVVTLAAAVKHLEICGKLDGVEKTEIQALQGLSDFAKKMKKIPSLVIDEANLVISGEQESLRLLSKVCSLTKEKREMNVTLCTSSHSYSHKLAARLQIQHTKIQYAAELSPKEMWHFLVEEKKDGKHLIGMGEQLARACIGACGGNIYMAYSLLETAH